MNKNLTLYEGYLQQSKSWYSKQKIFGVLLRGNPVFYFTSATNVDTNRSNNVCPIHIDRQNGQRDAGARATEGAMPEKPYTILPNWTEFNLEHFYVIKSRSTGDKFHLTKIATGERISFQCRDVCSRDGWLRKLNEAKDGLNESTLGPNSSQRFST